MGEAKAEIERLTATKDAEIIDSIMGVSFLTTAVFLAEAPQAIKERDLEALRLLAGVAPVTRASGKLQTVHMRYACNRRLRDACWTMGRTASRCDPYAKALYDRMIACGHPSARAYRGVADRLLTRLIACLKTGTTYSPPAPSVQLPAPAP
jgi:transposase